ncbi:MAG: TerD family protein [Streptosporangiaceae bacterium]
MTVALSQGANASLQAARITVEVAGPVRLDVSALLLTAQGKVRSDADFVFYNAPAGTGVIYRPATGGTPDSVTVELAFVPGEIEKVVVTSSLDQPGTTFAGNEPTAVIRDADSGAALATFTPPALTRETALVIVELYRRGAEWKVRAVGQGYADGLGGIAADFGVALETPAPPQAHPSAAFPTAPAAGQQQPHPGQQPFPGQAGHLPGGPPQVQKINLDKGKVSLQKGGSVSLTKGGVPFLQAVRMGLGWEPAKRGKRVDLDASCIAFDRARNKLATVSFSGLKAFGGVIQHSGDNLSGKGSGDDEMIAVHLGELPPEVGALVFTVNSYSGQRFTEVAHAYCRLLDGSNGQELVRFNLTEAQPYTGVMMCKLIRQPTGEWEMTALGEYADSKTVKGMIVPAANIL